MSKAFLTGAARKASAESDGIDLLKMLEAFRNGSIEARDAIIRAHYAIVNNMARRCAGKSPCGDDIYGDAIQLLVQAVDKARTNLAHDNITGYIISSVSGSLRSARIRHEHTLFKPPSTYSTQKLNGGVRQALLPADTDRFSAIAKREAPSLEFLEILESIATTDRERQIIELRKQSYSYEEIADIIELSPSRVGQIMLILTERFDKVY